MPAISSHRRSSHALPALAALLVMAASGATQAQSIGEVDTVFKWLGPDHKIVVDAFDDPKVKGVTCYVSRAKTGGIKGGLGLAEDKSEASIECTQVGPVTFVGDPLRQQEEVFTERISLVFKKLGSCAWLTVSATPWSISPTPIV